MSAIKTATTALTAALLMTGIGLAVAQSEDLQRADPPTQANATSAAAPRKLSEQTPADVNVATTDTTLVAQQDTMPLATPATPAAPLDNSTAVIPGNDVNATTTSATTPTPDTSYSSNTAPTDTTTGNTPAATPSDEPAPRADRN